MKVTAVICSYWPNRRPNVEWIIRDLLAGTRQPDRILILNNNPLQRGEPWITQDDRVEVIDSFNTTCRGKFVAALLDVADYYLLLDDDTSVGAETLQALCDYAALPETPQPFCTGFLGCWLDVNDPAGPSVHTGGRLWPRDATAITPCTTFCGCAMFCSFQALVNMLRLEALVRIPAEGPWPHQGDDLLLGLANPSVVVPLRGPEDFVDIGQEGQAMCWADEDYYGMRDRFLRDVLRRMEETGWQG